MLRSKNSKEKKKLNKLLENLSNSMIEKLDKVIALLHYEEGIETLTK